MDRYIGIDVHAKSCTLAVIDGAGKRIGQHVVETNGQALVDCLRTIPGERHVCIEEGTQSAWLFEILGPHVQEMIVANVVEGRTVYGIEGRKEYLDKLPDGPRSAVTILYAQHDVLLEVRKRSEKELVTEGRLHPATKIVATCPG